jgi:hypothetical protein
VIIDWRSVIGKSRGRTIPSAADPEGRGFSPAIEFTNEGALAPEAIRFDRG